MGDTFAELVRTIFWLGRDEAEMERVALGIFRRSSGQRTNSVPLHVVLSDVIRERCVPMLDPPMDPDAPAWRWAERVMESSL